MTTSLSSSLDVLSLSHTSSTRWTSDSISDDEDEIVWSLSSSAVLSSSSPLNSPLSETADFVLVPRIETSAPNALAMATTTATATSQEARARAPASLTPDGITEDMAALSLSTVPSSQPLHNDDDAQQQQRQSPTASATVPAPTKKKVRHHANKKRATSPSANPGPPSAAVAATTTTRPRARAATPPAPAGPRSTTTKRKKARTRTARASSSSSSSSSASSSAVIVALTSPLRVARASESPRQPRPLPPLPPPAPPPDADVARAAHDGLPTSSSSSVPKSSSSKGRAKKTLAAPAREDLERPIGLGLRAVVDDSLSEASGEELSSTATAAATAAAASAVAAGYHEAQKFMTSYLAHPPPRGNNNGSALLMLQALILELGCLPNRGGGVGGATAKFSIPELPGSLRQAKSLLKTRVFINVGDYLAVRDQGQAALRSVMHPSRKSLVQEVRKGKRVPVHEVKKAGLNVLLVNTRL